MPTNPFTARRQTLSTRTVDLDHDQLLVLECDPPTRVEVIFGGVWLTAEGEPGDHFPQGGEEVVLATKGRAILQALMRTRVVVVERSRAGLQERLRTLLLPRGRLSDA